MSSHHLPRPGLNEILRYRYHHGPNLGSIFVLEKWLHGSMFDTGAAGSSELDAVVSYDSHIPIHVRRVNALIPLQVNRHTRPRRYPCEMGITLVRSTIQ